MIFHTKIGILGEYLYEIHTLFILYLEGNHTLFGEKLYFICKFISGNTGLCFSMLSPFHHGSIVDECLPMSPSDSAHYAHTDLMGITMELWEILADGAIILHMIK